MASEWSSVTLEEIAADGNRPFAMGPFGSNIRSENYQDAGVPVIRGTNLSVAGGSRFISDDFAYLSEDKANELRSSTALANDIVFVAQGTVGKVGIVPKSDKYDRYILSQNLMRVRLSERKANPLYVYYFFQSADGQQEILSRANPTGVPCISRPLDSLRSFKVRLPSQMDEQNQIALTLGTLDDKIELNRKMNETLEAMARALFKSWFVDFDPVHAKAKGRDPGLPAHIAALFPNSFEDSELGEIPAGWKYLPLPELMEINPPRTLRKGNTAPYLDMANMPTSGHSADEVIDRPFGSGMRFINGDTLVARITPCLENGKTAFVDFLKENQVGWGSTEYIVLRPKPPLPEEFAYCLARSAEFRDFAIQSMTGSSGRQRVPAESLSHFKVASLPQPIAKQFGNLIKPLFIRARKIAEENRILAALRDTLLPKLISGEVRLFHSQQLLEEAVK